MAQGVTVSRHDSPLGRWELASRPPAPALAPYVQHLAGFREAAPAPLRRRELPHGGVVLIVSLDHDWGIAGLDGHGSRKSFAAGLHDGPVMVEHAGAAWCMEAYLSPLGARRFFGLPLDELARRVVELEDLFGLAAPLLAERLAAAPGWRDRLDLLEAAIARRLLAAPEPHPGVAWAWQRLHATAGQTDIGRLAVELGWSHRRLIARFRDGVGMSPKRVARILRFQQAVTLLREAPESSLAEVALECGYADQPHFNRDFRELAGVPPRELLADVNFVQDGDPVQP